MAASIASDGITPASDSWLALMRIMKRTGYVLSLQRLLTLRHAPSTRALFDSSNDGWRNRHRTRARPRGFQAVGMSIGARPVRHTSRDSHAADYALGTIGAGTVGHRSAAEPHRPTSCRDR